MYSKGGTSKEELKGHHSKEGNSKTQIYNLDEPYNSTYEDPKGLTHSI